MTSVEQQLDSLRSQFTEHSARRITEMRELLSELQAGPADTEALRKLRVHFHFFAGLGTTYGHPQATTLGDCGENRAAELMREDQWPANEDLAAWQKLVDALGEDLAS